MVILAMAGSIGICHAKKSSLSMSKELKTIGDLEINEDIKFEKRQWMVERIGWIAMFSLVIAAYRS
jgi:hypothetical protein